MVKSGKLTKQEIFYIEQNPERKTLLELSKELDRSPKAVAKHYSVNAEPIEEAVPPAPVKNDEAPMFKLMGRHERQGKHVATVMTRAASELADSTRVTRTPNKKIQSAIHKPKG